jgi:hypothetical protein
MRMTLAALVVVVALLCGALPLPLNAQETTGEPLATTIEDNDGSTGQLPENAVADTTFYPMTTDDSSTSTTRTATTTTTTTATSTTTTTSSSLFVPQSTTIILGPAPTITSTTTMTPATGASSSSPILPGDTSLAEEGKSNGSGGSGGGSSSSSNGAIIGGVVAGVVAVALLAGLAVALRRRRANMHREPSPSDSAESVQDVSSHKPSTPDSSTAIVMPSEESEA